MTPIEFSSFHNYHIRFRMKDGTELSGVVVNTLDVKPQRSATLYAFISTNQMIDWKQAEKDHDSQKMKDLQGEVDIGNIIWAERIK